MRTTGSIFRVYADPSAPVHEDLVVDREGVAGPKAKKSHARSSRRKIRQNDDLLDLSNQILELTKQVHAIATALPDATSPTRDSDPPS